MVPATADFDFLGMTFRYQKTSRRATKLTHCCYRWPRRKAVTSLKEKIRQRIGRHYSLSLEEVVHEINPILRGWYQHFKHASGSSLRSIDEWVRMRLRSIDVQLLRILEEMSAGRQESLSELRADIASLTKAIREHPKLSHLHVILHTSLSGVFNKSMVEKVGANDFLPKWEPDTLAMIVQEHLKQHAEERKARA
mgnify:CR=1 FL=1